MPAPLSPRLSSMMCAGVTLSLLLVAAWSSGSATERPGGRNATAKDEHQRPSDPALYVGAETCKTCHRGHALQGFLQELRRLHHTS